MGAPRVRRGRQWVEAALTRAGAFVTVFAECKDRAGMPKEKAIREHIELLGKKSEQLDTVALGFMEALPCEWDHCHCHRGPPSIGSSGSSESTVGQV